MKKILLFLTILSSISFFSCSNTKKSEAKSELQTYIFNVEGMTCSGCEQTIQANLINIEGVDAAKASHTEKTAIITFDIYKTDTTSLKEAIASSGYEVIGIKK